MAENDSNLLAVFEERMHDLVKLCNDRKFRIDELEASLNEKYEIIQKANQEIEGLQTKYKNLLTARNLQQDEEAFQNARKQINKLVREVDTCIALLNE